MVKLLRIADWDARYEVDDKGHAWKPGRAKRVKPLEYIRSKVFGLAHGRGFRRLVDAAGERNAAPVFGVFHRLLEVAGNQSADNRGTVMGLPHLPQTIADLAEGIGLFRPHVEKAIEVLTSPEVAWLEWTGVDENSRESRESREIPDPYIHSLTTTTKREASIQEDKKDTRAGNSRNSREIPELNEWADWWNRLHQKGLVNSTVDKPQSKTLQKAWRRGQKDREQRERLADRAKLGEAIAKQPWLAEPEQGWFDLAKLLGGKNQDRVFIAEQVLKGAYGGQRQQRHDGAGPGQRFDTNRPRDRSESPIGRF